MSVRLARERRGEADGVASLRVRLPTGGGFRTWQAGLAVLETFDDISAGGSVSGRVRPCNTLGVTHALSP